MTLRLSMIDIENSLRSLYMILNDVKRSRAKRQFYYRQIAIEKLRLSELNVCQGCIKTHCRNLSNTRVKQYTVKACPICPIGQLTIDYFIEASTEPHFRIHHAFNSALMS